MRTPAQQLTDKVLDDGWKVGQRIQRPQGATGGYFSEGYFVESSEGVGAYLKALDYWGALQSPDPASSLQAMSQAYIHERDLCLKCMLHRMSRVVHILGHGKIAVDPANPLTVVQYLIFELAQGDVRTQLDLASQFDIAWALRSLHHVATGLKQLHSVGIAHQDLKPSNVLQFGDKEFKIADLGRAFYKGTTGPHDDLIVAGDSGYAPPELLYKFPCADWSSRRMGCDAYLLGSMVVFFFTRSAMTALILANLDEAHSWLKWPGTFEEVLPYVRHAFGKAIDIFAHEMVDDIRGHMCEMVRQLCEPDPRLRGHPMDRVGQHLQFSLERYVSGLDLLATKAEYKLIGR